MSPQPPTVRITSSNGDYTATKITVDGVEIPCTRITWTCQVGHYATATVEIPRVMIDATVKAGLVQVGLLPPDDDTYD